MMTERDMRRFRQQLSDDETLEIIKNGKSAVMAVSGDNDYPYAVPINYVYNNGYIYIHSAAQGHKTDGLRRNPKCSLCVVDKDDVIPEEFTTYFRSVIAFGKAEFLDAEEDKIKALKLLCGKYSRGFDPAEEIKKHLDAVAVIRIKIEKLTGKESIELVQKKGF